MARLDEMLRNLGYSNWWFETGSPKSLVGLLIENGVLWHQLDGTLTSDELLSKFDVGDFAQEAIPFQTWCLTILGREEVDATAQYRLGIPNGEVLQSLNRSLLGSLPGRSWEENAERLRLRNAMVADDLAGVEMQLRALLAGIPQDCHRCNRMGTTRGGTRASCTRTSRGGAGRGERGSLGRADLVVRRWSQVCVFELNIRGRAGPRFAMEQLVARSHADRYRG